MKADRREFLWACAGFAAAHLAHAEESSFALWFPPEDLDLSRPFGFAVVASARCHCEVSVVNQEERSLFVAPDRRAQWELEPKQALSKLIETPAPETSSATAGVLLAIRPSTEKRPHFAGLIQILANPLPLTPAKPQLTAFTPGESSDKERLEESAEKLPFVNDPAPRPGEGYFTVDLRAESKLHLKIWPGKNQRGNPIYEHEFLNLPAGQNPVPWNLRNNRGSVVEAGEYLAKMLATPTSTGRSDTLYFASFQVV